MGKETFIFIVAFFLGFLIRSFFSHLFIASSYIRYMRDLEVKFLLMSVNFVQWKHYAIQVLELTHEKASEEDPEQKESFKVFRNKVEEKFDETGEKFISYISNILPYKPEYKNWSEALKYLDKMKREGRI